MSKTKTATTASIAGTAASAVAAAAEVSPTIAALANAPVTATAPVGDAKPAKATKPKAEKVVKAPKVPKEKVVKEAKPVVISKKSLALPIIHAGIAAGTARKDILAKLSTDLGLSAAGANTYYQNVKSGAKGWVVVAGDSATTAKAETAAPLTAEVEAVK